VQEIVETLHQLKARALKERSTRNEVSERISFWEASSVNWVTKRIAAVMIKNGGRMKQVTLLISERVLSKWGCMAIKNGWGRHDR
jgi:hypothetical protein